jgi:hypothetical protein
MRSTDRAGNSSLFALLASNAVAETSGIVASFPQRHEQTAQLGREIMGRSMCGLLVLVAIVGLFVYYFVIPWEVVVPVENRWYVIGILISITLGICVCSICETAVSSNTEYTFNNWFNSLSNRFQKQPFFWLRDRANAVIEENIEANSLIILINTTLTIVLSYYTTTLILSDQPGSNGFVIVGITLITFVIGETFPKQVTLRFRSPMLLAFGTIPAFLVWFYPTKVIGIGLTHALISMVGRVDD